MTTVQKHAQTAREFLIAAGREFEAGDKLQGSEKMWGAAAHAIMAVALQRGWSCGNHYAIKSAADRLAEELDDRSLIGNFLVAEQFHANFYHDFMEAGDIQRAGPFVSELVDRALNLI